MNYKPMNLPLIQKNQKNETKKLENKIQGA